MRGKTLHGLMGIPICYLRNEFLRESDRGGLTLMPREQKQACMLLM